MGACAHTFTHARARTHALMHARTYATHASTELHAVKGSQSYAREMVCCHARELNTGSKSLSWHDTFGSWSKAGSTTLPCVPPWTSGQTASRAALPPPLRRSDARCGRWRCLRSSPSRAPQPHSDPDRPQWQSTLRRRLRKKSDRGRGRRHRQAVQWPSLETWP